MKGRWEKRNLDGNTMNWIELNFIYFTTFDKHVLQPFSIWISFVCTDVSARGHWCGRETECPQKKNDHHTLSNTIDLVEWRQKGHTKRQTIKHKSLRRHIWLQVMITRKIKFNLWKFMYKTLQYEIHHYDSPIYKFLVEIILWYK